MNKIFRILCLAPLSILLTGCWTSILTVAPTTEHVAPVKTVYTTQVTTPSPKVTTVKTVTVTSFNEDMSFFLDLNAVAAAFAESRTVREFEQLLNSSRYMINNLDLNHDGWIDYLRVIETYNGAYHALLIQACLAPSVFQDVATLVAQHMPDRLYVEVVGDRWLYGANYIVRPVFVKRPPIWDVYGRPVYEVWTSPYYYGYYPSYYTQPQPVYLTHYQAYVTTYMSHNHYCTHCDYPTKPFYSGYTEMTRPHTRNDYQRQHPEDAFDRRVTRELATSTSGVSVRNSGQLRTEVTRQQQQTKEGTNTTSSRSASTTTTSTRNTGRTTATTGTSGSVRSTGNTSSTNTASSSVKSSKSQTSSQSSRSGSATSSSRSESTKASSRSESTGTSVRSTTKSVTPSTTVESRVSKSGTTRTTVRTTDASGKTTTIKRESASSKQSSTRTSVSTSSSRSSSSSSGSSSRTSGSSSRTSGSSSSTTSTRTSGTSRR
ncbi:MAG: hypothetical protein IKO26_01045 [Paludibacteraceae bacterium]|nr:hypothetical protein [Paludibacteraceae bacterium]